MPSKERLSWRAKILIIVLGPIVILGLLELVLRIVGFHYDPLTSDLENRTHSELQQVKLGLYEPDPDLLWTLRRSAVLTLEDAGFHEVHTNSAGLRGPELPGAKEPGELRVLCLGDSTGFCLGLRDGETWPERMEEALRAAPEMEGRTVRVINGAIPGYSSVQAMRLLERLRYLEPDVIVFWLGLGDSNPMWGLPDSAHRLPEEGARRELAVLWKLRVFQLVQSIVTKARESAAEGTRVSRAEFRGAVEKLEELERSGGPLTLFVREPECIDVTIAQLKRMVARAEEEGVSILLGPARHFSWLVPAEEGADLTGSLLPNGTGIVFQPDRKPEQQVTLDELKASLEKLEERKRAFDGILAGLPKTRLDYEDLFGDAPWSSVFYDNCHLSSQGAILAGKALAKAALEALRKRGR